MIPDDATLLRKFAATRDEAAFAELVRRHVDLVYSSARRRCGGNSHRAQEVVQHVFIALARNAARVAEHPALAAWLFTSVRNAARNLTVREQRRRERETVAMNDALLTSDRAEPAPEWAMLTPVIERELDALAEADRAAIVLRFFERRSFAEIGVALRLKENAARMRTERALEKLRERLAARGIHSASAALALAMTNHAVTAAPGGAETLAVSAALGALAGVGSVSLGTQVLQWLWQILKSGWMWAGVGIGAGSAVLVVLVLPPNSRVFGVELERLVFRSAERSSLPPTHATVRPAGGEAANASAESAAPISSESRAAAASREGVPQAALKAAQLEASGLLWKMAAVYASATTYRDSGWVTEREEKPDGRSRELAFETYYDRARSRFRFGWRTSFAYPGASLDTSGAVVADKTKATFVIGGSVTARAEGDLDAMIGLASVPSRAAAFDIPALLTPAIGGISMDELREPELLSNQLINGVECRRVRAKHVDGRVCELAIGKLDYFIRMIRTTGPRAGRHPVDASLEAAMPSAATKWVVTEYHANIEVGVPIPAFHFGSSGR